MAKTEEPSFHSVLREGSFEIRNYDRQVVAEVELNADFESSGNMAFGMLAGYIFGNNVSKTGVTLTSSTDASQKIAMTAPVSQLKGANGYLVQFTMPSKETLASLPTPKDSRVKLKEVAARQVVVWSYSGSWSKANYQSNLEKFKKELVLRKIQVQGEPIFARFNSPLQLWFLRRNEIWFEVSGN